MCEINIEKKYKHPPLIEALFEFRPNKQINLDFILLADLYKELSKDFPIKENLSLRQIQIQLDNSNLEQIQKVNKIIRLYSEDRASLIQLSDEFFTVHQLKPYSGWEKFKEMIDKAFGIYKNIVKPTGASNFSLKFVNQVSFKDGTIKLEDYFSFFIHTPNNERMMQNFLVKSDFIYEEKDVLTVISKSIEPNREEGNKIAILFDLQYTSNEVDIKGYDSYLVKAHKNILEYFENSITEKSRTELFEEEK